jgi:hypothetical protein
MMNKESRRMKTIKAVLCACVLLPGLAPGMILKPAEIHMWDTWCFHHDDTWYLYFLTSNDWKNWDGVAVCTSKDGVHWEFQGQPIRKRDNCVWLGTGSTWKSPSFAKDGKFQCNFSEQPNGEAQHIYFAESTDLIHWKRRDIEFRQDPRWYQEDGRWDCIYTIPRPGGGFYGYWTATPKDFVGFGFGETDDGVNWRALEPPKLEWGDNPLPKKRRIELGAVEKIGDRYYAIVGSAGTMVTFVADQPQGPFRAAAKNFQLLRGNCYFARFFPSPDGLLVTHHSITPVRKEKKAVCYAAPLKRAVVDQEGTLRLKWWEGNDALKGDGAAPRIKPAQGGEEAAVAYLDASVNVPRGTILEGVVTFPEDAEADRPGVEIDCAEGPAGAIQLVSSSSTAGGTRDPQGKWFHKDPRQGPDRQLPPKAQARFRLLVRHSLVELYLDDVLMNVYSLPKPASGRIGFLNNASGISELKAWTMTLPEG